MNSPKISIIVPVYKVEKYLRRCVDSIVAQTFTDWECILIDDGSPDNSGKICDEYAEKDERFRVIHQENQGVSAARQNGLNNSIGEYVIHTDPDDYVENIYLEKLFERAQETDGDMVMCDFERIFSDKTIVCSQKPTSLVCDDIIKDLLEEKIWGIMWNKLIKRKLFCEFNISFRKDMNLWEDLYVTISLLIHNIKVAYVPLVLYHYDSFTNPNGIVMHRNKEHIISMITFVNQLYPRLSTEKFEKGWFHLKSKIKKEIFIYKIIDIDVKEIFSEINNRYITRYNKISQIEYCITLCIKGYPFIANALYFARRVKNKILY